MGPQFSGETCPSALRHICSAFQKYRFALAGMVVLKSMELPTYQSLLDERRVTMNGESAWIIRVPSLLQRSKRFAPGMVGHFGEHDMQCWRHLRLGSEFAKLCESVSPVDLFCALDVPESDFGEQPQP
jgi:hypothetical protein